jgi:hypothetical protein
MASQGPNTCGTAANLTGVGSLAWTNPSNATASDDVYATNTGAWAYTNYLKCTNFGFSIPEGSTITGVVAEIECKFPAGLGNQEGSTSKLVVGGSVTGSGLTATKAPVTEGTISMGGTSGSAGLWYATAPTVAQVNASDFGVAVSWGINGTLSIDLVQVTVHYTTGGGGTNPKNPLNNPFTGPFGGPIG